MVIPVADTIGTILYVTHQTSDRTSDTLLLLPRITMRSSECLDSIPNYSAIIIKTYCENKLSYTNLELHSQ